MSYVGEPFEYDVFVTYSHGTSDDGGESKLKRWSQAFASELESELKTNHNLARSVVIFVDEHAQPAQAVDPLSGLTEQLRCRIEGSALLTVLMSPDYLDSKWCEAEREWWSSHQPVTEVPIDGRIAVARVLPTSQPWPRPLVDGEGERLVGFQFFDRSAPEAVSRPFGWPEPGPSTGDPFRRQLLALVGHLTLKLDETKKRLDARRLAKQARDNLAAESGQIIYLHGRQEYRNEWDRAYEALDQSGFVVLPVEPDPVVTDPLALQEIRQRRVDTLSGCDALLLVAADSGRATEADLVVVGRQDRHSARAISNRLLPCAVLDRAGQVAPAMGRRRDAARKLSVDWIDATQESTLR